uniref:Uncharacterized protein n=1 Tax=Timema tahoe TaxID=61484 RepID=A0A7R9IL25_9NEOP|nr:unnamed protein product [Timema tahoe]
MTSPLDLSASQYVHDSAPIYCTVDFFICTLSPLSTLFDGPEYLLHHPPLKDVELALIGLPCCTGAGVVTAPSAPPPPVGQPPTPSRHVVSCYNTPMAMLASTHNHEQEVNSISEKKNALREKLEQLEERAAIKSREMMELKQTVLKLQQQQDWQLTNVPPPATPKVDPSLEGIKAAMDNILVKCRTKDQMITAMADELQRQRRSSAMERVLIDVATDKANMVPDFDRALLHEYLQCVYVNGNIQERVRSATRNRTLLHGLDLTRKMDILVYALTPKGKFADPAFVSYQDTVDRPRGISTVEFPTKLSAPVNSAPESGMKNMNRGSGMCNSKMSSKLSTPSPFVSFSGNGRDDDAFGNGKVATEVCSVEVGDTCPLNDDPIPIISKVIAGDNMA